MKEIRIKSTIFINPYAYYCIFWTLSLAFCILIPHVYTSSIGKFTSMPSAPLLFALICTILISAFMAYRFEKKYKNHVFSIREVKPQKIILPILLVLYLFEFWYCGTVPLFNRSAYDSFGVPTLHVVIVTFSTYYFLKRAIQYRCYKKIYDLITCCCIVLFYVLIYSRGLLIFLLGSLVVLLLAETKLNVKNIVLLGFLLIISAYLFGVLGNLRGSAWNDSSGIIKSAGLELDNNIFAPFLWIEEYASCGLAVLNANFIQNIPSCDLNGIFISLIPDFIAKRIFDFSSIHMTTLSGYNVGTMYFNTVQSIGWIGIVPKFLLTIAVVEVFIRFHWLEGSNQFMLLGFFTMIFAMSIFHDIMLYSGYSFSIIYCIIDNEEIYNRCKKILKLKGKDSCE